MSKKREEVEIKLPKLGESIVSATVIQWFKQEGDTVKLDEPLLEVSTDKVNSEIPSPVSGKVSKIIANPDDELDVGAILGYIITADVTAIEGDHVIKDVCDTSKSAEVSKKSFFTPVVLKMAQEKGIALSELGNIPATGAGNRLSKRDLEKYLNQCRSSSQEIHHERIKMTTMRKTIADNMVRSFYEAPHATLVNEVDVTSIMEYLAKEKENFKNTHGYKLTITAFIAQAIGQAVTDFPFINSKLEGDTIVIKKEVNLGIAVNVNEGILVPVIANCHIRSIEEIAKEVATLSNKARSGTLTPNQVKEGSLTMTNFGMTGTLIGTPIIRYGEVAIIGIGAINKKVVVQTDNSLAIRSMMYLTLTFDHRVLDGMYGCSYLAAIKNILEQPSQIK